MLLLIFSKKTSLLNSDSPLNTLYVVVCAILDIGVSTFKVLLDDI